MGNYYSTPGSNLACISQITNSGFAEAAGFTPVLLIVARSPPIREVLGACKDFCGRQDFAYAGARILDDDENLDANVECTCYHTVISAGDVLPAVLDSVSNFCQFEEVAYLKTTRTFDQVTCFVAPAIIPPSTTVDSYADCFQQCLFFGEANIIPSTTGSTFQCSCDPIGADQALTACGRGVVYGFEHPGLAQVSGLARRGRVVAAEKRARDRLAPGGDMEHCPAGLTACRISDSDLGGYECIDTKEELESYGGCLWGKFGTLKTDQSSFGTDYTKMPGTSLGGSTCLKGVCNANFCEEGYTLFEGECYLET